MILYQNTAIPNIPKSATKLPTKMLIFMQYFHNLHTIFAAGYRQNAVCPFIYIPESKLWDVAWLAPAVFDLAK